MSLSLTTPVKISPSTVANRRGDDDTYVLDVRNESDYEDWSIDPSHNVPIYDQLLDEDFSGLEGALDSLPEDEEILVVCVAGITSTRAATFLRDHGFEARSVTDGMRGWGRVHRAFDVPGATGVTQVVRPGTGCLSYLVADRDEALVVDPSQYTAEYRRLAEDRDVDIVGVVDTHAHADHVSGGPALADAFDVPYYLPGEDSGNLADYAAIEDGDTLTVGDRELDVLQTPGHTPGSCCLGLADADVLLSGDTLFLESVGRPDLGDDDEARVRDLAGDLYDNLQRLTDLPDDTLVLPGHFTDQARRPLATTLYSLEEHNEHLQSTDRETFVDQVVSNLSDTPANHEDIKAINQGDASREAETEDLELGPNNCAA